MGRAPSWPSFRRPQGVRNRSPHRVSMRSWARFACQDDGKKKRSRPPQQRLSSVGRVPPPAALKALVHRSGRHLSAERGRGRPQHGVGNGAIGRKDPAAPKAPSILSLRGHPAKGPKRSNPSLARPAPNHGVFHPRGCRGPSGLAATGVGATNRRPPPANHRLSAIDRQPLSAVFS